MIPPRLVHDLVVVRCWCGTPHHTHTDDFPPQLVHDLVVVRFWCGTTQPPNNHNWVMAMLQSSWISYGSLVIFSNNIRQTNSGLTRMRAGTMKVNAEKKGLTMVTIKPPTSDTTVQTNVSCFPVLADAMRILANLISRVKVGKSWQDSVWTMFRNRDVEETRAPWDLWKIY